MAAQGTQQKYDHDRIERAARIYSSSKDAATALGIAQDSFIRGCPELRPVSCEHWRGVSVSYPLKAKAILPSVTRLSFVATAARRSTDCF